MTDLKYQLLALLAPFAFPFLLCLATLIATFGWFPPESIQADLHLLGHFCAPILLPFLSLLLSLQLL